MNSEKNKFTPTEALSQETKSKPINKFMFDGIEQPVSFVETTEVTDGVKCDVYTFVDGENKDLGIIRIEAGKKTPLQRVLQGEKTIEQYVSGSGKLVITHQDGAQEILIADASNNVSKQVEIGELMQWEAVPDSGLVAAEICFPPYRDGRFENVE